MIRTLIVDDDIEMLQGLEHIICWEQYGFMIVGKADNGADALQLVKTILPEVLITDITMPGLNGLELIREAKKIQPEIKAILLTCHEDFHFAKAAIELASEDYLVKYTLTEKELINTLLKVKTKWQAEQRQKNTLSLADPELALNKALIRDNFFRNLLKNPQPDLAATAHTAQLLNIALPDRPFQAIGLFIDDGEEFTPELTTLNSRIANIIEAAIQGNFKLTFFALTDNAWLILSWVSADSVTHKQKTLALAKTIQHNTFQTLNISLSATISSIYPDFSQLNLLVREVYDLRESYFYSVSGACVSRRHVFASGHPGELYKKYEASLKAALETGDTLKLVELIEQLVQVLASANYRPANVKSIFRRILVDIEAVGGRYEITFERFKLTGDTFDYYQKTLFEIIQFFREQLNKVRSGSRRSEVTRVTDYINSHLNEDIRCEKMAKLVNMNSSYFSRLFKTEVGVNFSDYLIQRRMEVASILLVNSDASINEIAKAVGIENPSYFYRVYKKITGKTPGNMRNCP